MLPLNKETYAHGTQKLVVAFVLLGLLAACPSSSQADEKLAYDLLPSNTQAVVWIPNSEQLMEKWSRTQLSELVQDESIAPFFEGKRQEIEKRFLEAGWRLSIKPEDVGQYSTGQLAFAWTNREDPVKPYTMMLLCDVENDADINAKMIEGFEKQLESQKATKQQLSHNDLAINKYTLPPRAGEYFEQQSFVVVVPGAPEDDAAVLLATDNLELIKTLIDKLQGKSMAAGLAADETFQKGRELAGISGEGNVEYFVRPIGFAEVIKAIAGKRSKSRGNWLNALKNQGFGAVKCIAGEIKIGAEELDLEHHGYVYADLPLTKSAKVLNFPNQASLEVPNFVGEDVASLLVTNWVANQAFWELEGIVDEIANTAGVFQEVIAGFKTDAHGPQVDLRQVLPLFTNDIYSIADNRDGEAEVDSRRNLLALKLKDADKMSKILREAMNNEVDATQIDFEGYPIWQVTEVSGDANDEDFGDFVAPAPKVEKPKDENWLSNWAITVYGDYLLFASHLEVIQDAIEQGNASEVSPFVKTDDYKRAQSAIAEFFGHEQGSAWRILRSSKAYRIQYELFRKGELRKSESMLASILDRMVQKDDELEKDKEQKISGEGLPEFSEIEQYLEPSAFKVSTTQNGWEFGSFLLAKDYVAKENAAGPEVTRSSAQYGTATAPHPVSKKR